MKVMPNKFKLVFFGSPSFASYSLSALLKANFKITAVVTQKPKFKGRNKILTATDLSVTASHYGLKIITPDVFDNKVILELKKLKADAFVVVAYGKILPPEIINLPPKGLINLHPSLLPKYRGPSPVQNTLLNNDKLTGLSIMKLDNKVDHGPILYQIIEPIKSTDNNQSLTDRLFALGANYLPKILFKYLNDELTPIPQDHTKATYTKMIKKEDGLINWQKDATTIRQQILAFQPWPAAYTYCQKKLFKIYLSKVIIGKFPPGKIKIDKKNTLLLVGTGKDTLSIEKIQPEGKNILNIKDFISGYNLDGLFFTTHPKT